jgi:organic radical activating enzyme
LSRSGLPYTLATTENARIAEVKRALQEGILLPVMEQFYTIQGEGRNTGRAAYFVRLGGCDVGCFWCDVKESWDAGVHPLMSAAQIVDQAAHHPKGLVVVTGGEPLMYPLDNLTAALKSAGFELALETSGAHPLSGKWDWICFSPKKFKEPKPEFYTQAQELKVIIYNRHDFSWAEQHRQRMNKDALCYLQPEWDKRQEMLPLIIEYVKKNPAWRISLQTHKYLDIP